MITPYALMMDDPTTSVMICWIDERVTKDGEPHTLTVNGTSQQATVWAALANGDYIYRADLTGLTPNTQYEITIDPGDGAQSITPVKTFPQRLPADGLKILAVSDTHAHAREMTNAATFSPMANEQVDAYIIFGDGIGANDFSRNSDNADIWVAGMRDYLSQVNKDYMPHICYVPGNHDVGNTSNNGTSLGSKTGTLFRDFFPNQYEVIPVDTNHCAITIGDYFQILGGDCYSGYPSEVGQLIKDYHDDTVALCLFGAHSPMFSADDMRFVPQDNQLQERMRNECFEQVTKRYNIKFVHGGNIHIRSITWPLKFVTQDPQTSDSFAVSGDSPGWIVRAENDDEETITEFGQGWLSNRSGTFGWWFFETDANQQYHHFIVDIKPGIVRHRSISQTLAIYDDRTWPLPRIRRFTGAGTQYLSPNRVKEGAWKASEPKQIREGAWQ